MSISIKIKNQARLASAWKKAPAEMAKGIADTLRKSGVYATGKVKEVITSGTDMWKAPIDTGALRRGIHPIFESKLVRIVPASYTPYAQFVHEGTGRMRARPFFEITAKVSESQIQKFAIENINKVLKKLDV